MDDRDVSTIMTALFEIQTKVADIHEAILGEEDDDDAEPEAEDG